MNNKDNSTPKDQVSHHSNLAFEINLAISKGGYRNTDLKTWQTDFTSFINQLSTPTIGPKDGSYFIRCNGTKRNNADTSNEAYVLILDGDSRIDENGEVKSGAPDPETVHQVLTRLDVSHLIYSSHSNGASEAELIAKKIDCGGEFDSDYHKYRVVILCRYSPEKLPILLGYLFGELHKAGVMLVPVSENRTWSQPWYFPRVPDQKRLEIFRFYQHEGNALDVDTIYSDWRPPQAAKPEPKLRKLPPKAKFNIPGQRNPIHEFNECYTVGEILERNGYEKIGDRYLRPDSQSKIPGVQICLNCADGVERVYSHGGDVLNDGFAHDAFDCFCLLECEGVVKQALGWSPEISKHNQRQYMRDKCLSNSQNPAFFAPTLSGTCAIDGTSDTRPLTELGNAQRIIDEYGQDIRYVYDAKAWLYWENGAWYWCLDGSKIRRLAATLPDKIYEEGKLHLAEAEFYAKHARISQKERTIEAAVSLLHNFEQIRLPLAKIDAEELLIGLQGARSVLDLKTGSVRPAQRNDFITKAMNVGDIGCSDQAKRWLRFLAEVFCDDLELIDWFKRWCGYLLTGSTREQFFVFCFGLGANGKSVLAEILRYISGDYARVVAVETLTEAKRQAGGATPDLADLIGARLALSPETEDGVALAESLIKSLVAGDTVTARKLYSQPIQFTPKFKLMMLGNHKPIIRGTDYGIWRRVRLLPFVRVFSEQERDPCLLETLKEEAPDILAWMAEGCLEWQKRGLSDVPNTIRQATVEYQSEQDLIGQWIAECCVVAGNVGASASEIYSSYKQWCIDNGLRTGSKVSLGRRLTERGFTSRKSHGNKIWLGIAVDLASDLQPLGFAA